MPKYSQDYKIQKMNYPKPGTVSVLCVMDNHWINIVSHQLNPDCGKHIEGEHRYQNGANNNSAKKFQNFILKGHYGKRINNDTFHSLDQIVPSCIGLVAQSFQWN